MIKNLLTSFSTGTCLFQMRKSTPRFLDTNAKVYVGKNGRLFTTVVEWN